MTCPRHKIRSRSSCSECNSSKPIVISAHKSNSEVVAIDERNDIEVTRFVYKEEPKVEEPITLKEVKTQEDKIVEYIDRIIADRISHIKKELSSLKNIQYEYKFIPAGKFSAKSLIDMGNDRWEFKQLLHCTKEHMYGMGVEGSMAVFSRILKK